ncbi:hypothetical protein KJ608_02850 [Patescibacteria group bacterium]|nr:hypothetical protein [Patescibacteria group bacterium]
MTSYFFYDADSDDYVSAEGSWLSTTQLAFPIQTIKMDCWKDNMSCIVATTTLVEGTGSLDLNHLDLDIDYEGIATWSKEEIKTVPRSTVTGCVEYATVIDRKSETVTSTRRTISAEGDCSVIQEESVVLTLGDGYERINLWRQGK